MQFSFRAAKVERSLSHLVPLERSLSLLVKCVVTETAPRAAGVSEPSPARDLTSHFQREAVISVQDTAKVGCRPGAEKTQLVCFVLFCLSYPSCGLAKPGCLAPGGCELQATLCAVSMAVDRGDAQPGGWRWLTCSAAGSLGSWSSGYCLYESELCVREL